MTEKKKSYFQFILDIVMVMLMDTPTAFLCSTTFSLR
jgi:hypothetical protein